jgi:hypothetical protein
MSNDSEHQPSRQYPPIYEKIVPIALVLIAVAIIVVLLIILYVVFGLAAGT